MRILITEYFKFPVEARRDEVTGCIKDNINSGLFDKVVVLSEKDECDGVPTVITGSRLTYKDTFEYANKHLNEGDLVYIANSDIKFDETIKQIELDSNTCITLTRWELDGNLHPNYVASQDTWGFRVPIRVPPKSDFFFGTYGCDNYIASLLKWEGYRLWNPCLTVKTHHIHSSEVRTYEVKPMKPFYNYTFPDPAYLDEEFPASFCTISTWGCVHELVGLLLTLRKNHRTEPIYVLVDTATKNYIKKCLPFLENVRLVAVLDKYTNKDRKQMESEGIWSDFQMQKSVVIDQALRFSPDTMFLDSDMLVLDALRVNKKYELGVSPHYIKKSETDQHGYYNGGMLWTRNKQVPSDWREFTKTSRFYDQASIEDLAKKYTHFEFDETYNIGWWRLLHTPETPQDVANRFWIQGPTYKNRTVKSVHTHFDRNDYSKPFNDFIKQVLTKSFRWFELMVIERMCNRCWSILIPKQPLEGKYAHNNDSFRELAPLTAEKVEDVYTFEAQGITVPRIGHTVCLYDRPQGHWMTDEVKNSLKVFLGNMDASEFDDTKISPWIFWPRRPRVLEAFMETPQPNKDIESIFIGNIENEVQAKNRDTKWSDVIQEFHLTNGHSHKLTQDEYLHMMARSKFGLCMKGYGLKCHREVECMALGVVPLVVDGVPMDSYLDPPKEGVHYLRVSGPEDVPRVIEGVDWVSMSEACKAWYLRNVHSNHWWFSMLKKMVYLH